MPRHRTTGGTIAGQACSTAGGQLVNPEVPHERDHGRPAVRCQPHVPVIVGIYCGDRLRSPVTIHPHESPLGEFRCSADVYECAVAATVTSTAPSGVVNTCSRTGTGAPLGIRRARSKGTALSVLPAPYTRCPVPT